MRKYVFVIIMCLLSVIYPYYSFKYFTTLRTEIDDSNTCFVIFVALTIIFLTTIIVFTQFLSISLVNEAANKWEIKPCKYCGHEKSKLVCPECDSIQWNSKNRQIIPSIAIFLAHHRWKVISAIFTIFLIGPLLFAFKFHFEEIDKIHIKKNEINKDIQYIIEFSNDLRPRLKNLEYTIHDDSLNKSAFIEVRQAILKSYYDYAWNLAEITDYLKHQLDNEDKHNAYVVGLELLTYKNLIPRLDDTFFAMIENINLQISKPGSEITRLKEYINLVDIYTKGISCAIGEISFNENLKHKESGEKEIIDDCLKDIREALKGIAQIPATSATE